MEASALPDTARSPQALIGRSPLLRLQSDEKLIALTRRGNPGAFDTLVQRYQARLLSFLRHMLGSTEDAEDVLQEVFASAFNAIRADERPINARPWLYRIARNRALNHLRRPSAAGQDTMDVFERASGETTADAVHKREDFRLLVADVQELPESQRTALLMREIDALSYEQIAEAMETTVPSVKSLLVRARVGLAEAAEARMLSCAEARLALGEAEEGVATLPAAVRRHVKGCERCRTFRSELKKSSRVLAAAFPIGPLVLLQRFFWGKFGAVSGGGGAGTGAGGGGMLGGSTVAGGSAWGGGAAASGSAVGGLVGGGVSGGLLSTGVGTIATKAAAGIVAAAVVTAGAVEVAHLTQAPSKRKAEQRSDGPTARHRPHFAPVPPAEAPAGGAAASSGGDAEPRTSASSAEDPAAAVGDATVSPSEPATQPSGTETPDPVDTTAGDVVLPPDTSVSDGGSTGGSTPPVDSGTGGGGGSSSGSTGAGASSGAVDTVAGKPGSSTGSGSDAAPEPAGGGLPGASG